MDARWLVAWGVGAVALGGASLIVPLYVVALGGTAFTLGVLAAAAAFAGAPAALLTGPLADRTGRYRELVLAGLGLITAMLLVIPVTQSVPLIIVANAGIWCAFAGLLPVLTLLSVAGTPDADWPARIARLNKFQGVGWAIGLVLGALMTGLGGRWAEPMQVQRGALVLYAVLGGGAMLAGVRYFPPDPRGSAIPDPRRLRRALNRAARFSVRGGAFPFTPVRLDVRGARPRRLVERFTPQLAQYFLALVLFFAGFAAFFAPLPAFLSTVGFTGGEIFLLYVLTSLGSAVFFTTAGRLSAQHGAAPVQVAGLLIRAVLLPAVAIVGLVVGAGLGSLLLGGVLFVLIGLSWALIIVTTGAIVTELAPPTVRGEALGMYSALMALAGGIGSIIGGRLAVVDYLLAFGVAGGLIAIGAVVVAALRHRARPTG